MAAGGDKDNRRMRKTQIVKRNRIRWRQVQCIFSFDFHAINAAAAAAAAAAEQQLMFRACPSPPGGPLNDSSKYVWNFKMTTRGPLTINIVEDKRNYSYIIKNCKMGSPSVSNHDTQQLPHSAMSAAYAPRRSARENLTRLVAALRKETTRKERFASCHCFCARGQNTYCLKPSEHTVACFAPVRTRAAC
jgi:hypothetical protein